MFRRILAVAAMLAAPLLAVAQTQPDMIASIASRQPHACLDGAMEISRAQTSRMTPDWALQGMGKGMQLGASWAPGSAGYDRSRVILAQALAEDEDTNGPYVDFGFEQIFRKSLDSASPAELRSFAKFLASPTGTLYWDNMMEGAICQGIIEGVSTAPYFPLEGEALSRATMINAGMDAKQSRFEARYKALSKANRASFDTAMNKWAKAFNNALASMVTERQAGWGQRIKAAVEPHMAEIRAIVVADNKT